MKARPLFENILIQPIKKKKETKSGILLPDTTDQNNIIEGTVVAIGEGEVLPVVLKHLGNIERLAHKNIVVKVGEHVVFKQYAATPIKIGGESYYLVNQRDLLSVIDYE